MILRWYFWQVLWDSPLTQTQMHSYSSTAHSKAFTQSRLDGWMNPGLQQNLKCKLLWGHFWPPATVLLCGVVREQRAHGRVGKHRLAGIVHGHAWHLLPWRGNEDLLGPCWPTLLKHILNDNWTKPFCQNLKSIFFSINVEQQGLFTLEKHSRALISKQVNCDSIN